MDKFTPKVSVIMPVYNGSNYLREAIDSVINQTYSNIEIIVVNDGSNDDGQTENIALSYQDKIRYFKKDNGGVATALNLGIQSMTGEYFSWLSHDDLYYPQKIETQIALLSTLADKKTILYGGYDLINPSSKVIGSVKLDTANSISKLNTPLFPILRGLVNGCTLLVHKDHFARTGLFDPMLKTTQDYALWFKMFRDANIMFSDKILVKTRIHDDRGTFKIPNHLDECNELWIGFLNEITKDEMVQIEESIYLFYQKTAEFLESTPYDAAANYARSLADKDLEETKISVIVPFYNRVTLTLESIHSVLDQTHSNFELLLIDDGSSEDVAPILDVVNSDKRLIYYRQSNKGPSAARNYGLSKSTGSYVAFLDSDDLYTKDKLEIQLKQMKTHNSVFSHTLYIKKRFDEDHYEKVNTGAIRGNVFPRIIASCGIAMPTVMLLKQAIANFQFDENISIGEDVCAWIDLSYNFELLCIDEYLTIVRVGDQTSAYNSEKQIYGLFNIIAHVRGKAAYNTSEVKYCLYLLLKDLAFLFLKESREEASGGDCTEHQLSSCRSPFSRGPMYYTKQILGKMRASESRTALLNRVIRSIKQDGWRKTVHKIRKQFI